MGLAPPFFNPSQMNLARLRLVNAGEGIKSVRAWRQSEELWRTARNRSKPPLRLKRKRKETKKSLISQAENPKGREPTTVERTPWGQRCVIKRRNVEFRRFKPYQSAVATEAKAKGNEEIFDFTGGKPEQKQALYKKRELKLINSLFLKYRFGNDLSSREATLRVLSAMKVFTTVFGMGTGGVLSLCHRKSGTHSTF